MGNSKRAVTVHVALCVCAFTTWVTAASAELSAADKAGAEAHVAALASEDFDIRAKADKELRELVFKDSEKAAAWDAWLDEIRGKTKDAEALSRLPQHIRLMAKLRGTWTFDHLPGERDDSEIIFNMDGSFVFLGSQLGEIVLKGQYRVGGNEVIVMEARSNDDTFWSRHVVLKGDKIEMIVETDGKPWELPMSRKTEKKDGAAK